ncbi:hypothetical protein QPK32_01600 [Massilia sp. YIM B02763]|uniref:hypothetical protein n=1 Tax=Massilia sp. YIM B02763 TaxID=3050130 RepID=UPI0025B6B53B|nr:hypothetical protein [Massilia sp. YIM B02763]MDN4051779.1 hypothetical protein [Massilia sp. YIM B02763]
MTSQNQFADALFELRSLSKALDDISSNPYHERINRQGSLEELFDAILAFDYAANSKELRDTGDERVHALLNEVREVSKSIYPFFVTKICPESSRQAQEWQTAARREPSATYAFQDNGSTEISLLDATLDGSTLIVKRLWSYVSNFDGTWTNLKVGLGPKQVEDLKTKFAELGAIRSAFR